MNTSVLKTNIIVKTIVLLLICNNVQSQTIFSKTLKTLEGKNYNLNELKKNKGNVFIIISPDCPLCQNYALTLNEQQKQFAPKKIKYIGVVSGKIYTVQEINHYKKLFNVQFELLIDENYEIKKALGASVTPEVFLINNLGKTIYSGRIDDWAYDVGKHKPKATEHNLKDAVNAYIAGKPIKIKKTKAVGCILE